MGRRSLTNAQISLINIIGSITVVALNALISLFLSPFIIERLGVEANGYISLANNFISYMSIIIAALNSTGGRFMFIEMHKKDLESANSYYSSLFFGDWILGGLLLIPSVVFVIGLENFVAVEASMISDIKILFALTFANFFLPLFLPKWSCATYVTNKLYLRSLKSVISAIVRVVCILVLFIAFKPAAYFVAIAGLAMTLVNTLCESLFKRKLLPQLKVKLSSFSPKKVWILITSGIWNSISKCGTILLEGLDLLVANLLIDPTSMGILSVSKIIPNMLNQVISSTVTTFNPTLTRLYADGDRQSLKKEIGRNIKTISIITTIPVGIIIVCGRDFFKLWVPSQNAEQLALLSTMTMIGLAVTGIASCVTNIFGVANRLKANALMTILSGLINIGVVYILLKATRLGIYAIAGVSPIISILRVLFFSLPYAAHCIELKPFSFHGFLLKGIGMAAVPLAVSLLIRFMITPDSWLMFLVCVGIAAIVSLGLDLLLFLRREERKALFKIFAKKGKKKT